MNVNGSRRVVITGVGPVTPVGIGVEDFWNGISSGRSGVGLLRRFDASEYSCKIAAELPPFPVDEYVPKSEQRRLDPFVIYAVAAAEMAMRDAGLSSSAIDLDRAGVVIGSGIGGIATIEIEKETLMSKGPRRISPYLIPKLIVNMASGIVAMRYGMRGPNSTVVTACATGNHSIGEAFRAIRYGDADVMLAGGAEAAITPLGFGGFCAMHAMSTRNDDPARASRPFDATRDGFVMGEGAGVVVLEELGHARARGASVYAELVGFAMTADAHHMTQPLPDGAGIRRAMGLALQNAGLQPEEVDYINAHGTSTPYNDKTETLAIKTLFGDHAHRLVVSSTKSMTGHLLGAAGGVEMIATALALKHQLIPPTINYETPDPDCDLDYCPNQARPATLRCALSNSMGFGGQNAVLVARTLEG